MTAGWHTDCIYVYQRDVQVRLLFVNRRHFGESEIEFKKENEREEENFNHYLRCGASGHCGNSCLSMVCKNEG